MATSLGKVGIVDKGNYSSEATYNSSDFVFYEGSTWLALKDGLMGIEPVEGENWKYLARGVPDGIATVEQVGVVKPSEDLTIEPDGTLGINTMFETIAERANIESGDTWKTVLGKINKYFGDIKPHAFLDKITEEYIDSVITEKVNNAIQKSRIIDNFTTQIKGFIPDATLVTDLNDRLVEQNYNISYEDYSDTQYPEPKANTTFFSNWKSNPAFPAPFGEGILIKGTDKNWLSAYYQVSDASRKAESYISRYNLTDKTFEWDKVITNSDLIRSEKINTVNIDNEYLSVTVNWCVRLNVCYVTLYNLTAKQVFDPIVIYDQLPKAHVGNHLDFFNKSTGNWFGSGWLDDGTSVLYCRLGKIDNFAWLSFSYPVRST